MSETTPEVERRDRGLALADSLLESNRRFQPLPAAAHERVKRRLRARLYSPAFRRARWLRPVVVAGSLLLWGTAFGIAIDHFVLKHDSPSGPQVQPAAAPDNHHARRSRARPERPISVESDRTMPSEPAVSQEVAAPRVEPPARKARDGLTAAGSLRTPANLPLSGSCRASCSDARCLHKSVCRDRPGGSGRPGVSARNCIDDSAGLARTAG